jgi:alpha-methylacyl-CoA racemase
MNQPVNLPLTGLKVLELQAIGPVPFAGMVLQSLGAQVCRVLSPQNPGLGIDIPAQFDALNADKQVAILDLKSAGGIESLLHMASQSDVLLEGFRPGVLERLGLRPEQLARRAPKLVVGRLSGWGNQGQLAQRAGHDINYLALSGALHAIGEKDRPIPPLNLVADFGGGAMHLVVGILAKLLQRSLDPLHQGGVVTTSILAGTHGLLPMFHGLVQAGLQSPQRSANLLDSGAPFYRCYETADNQHVAVGALEPKFYHNLITLLNLQTQLDLTQQYQISTWPQTTALLTFAFKQKTRDQWAALAMQSDCCLSPVLTFAQARTHSHNQANHWFSDQPGSPVWPTQIVQFD